MADIQTDIATAKADEAKVVAWYKSHQFYAGLIAGVLACALVVLVVSKHHL